MKITDKIIENNVINGINAERSSVIKETLSRTKNGIEINKSFASNDINISERALIFSKIRDVINRLPEVRYENIESIKNDMLTGEYNVSAEQVVSKLLGEHIFNGLTEE